MADEWVRDGSIISTQSLEICLYHEATDTWISIQGTHKTAEQWAVLLLALLNVPKTTIQGEK